MPVRTTHSNQRIRINAGSHGFGKARNEDPAMIKIGENMNIAAQAFMSCNK